MDVVILAGGISTPHDPLFPLTAGGYKALLEIAGKPMLQWVLDALGGSRNIEEVLIVGLPDISSLSCSHPLHRLDGYGTIIGNIRAGAEKLLQMGRDPKDHFLSLSADLPAITPAMVDWVIAQVKSVEADLYYSVIERRVMEKRYPGSKRTYAGFKDYSVCGGDLNAVRIAAATKQIKIFEDLSNNRKNVFKQASILGFDLLWGFLFKRFTLQEAAQKVCSRLDITGKAILNPFAEVGMDVDKPFQYTLMQADLNTRC